MVEPRHPDDPYALCARWLREAADRGAPEPHAMALATATPAGRPSVRIVYYKELDESGLVFVTNYESRKGEELSTNPHAAVAFFWQPLMRQLRIEGAVERAEGEVSDRLYAARARNSRLGAWASPQSRPIADREYLDRRVRQHDERFGEEIPRPGFWGAYRLRPERYEFWTGRPFRLHDRFVYTRAGTGWTCRRLAP